MLRLLLLFRNARPWLRRCFATIFDQSVTDWHCHVVDDMSDDGSWELVQNLTGGDLRFTLVRNTERLYQCGSSQRILDNPTLNDQDICVAIDGDDYLPDPFVFERILDAYSDGKTWVTWGSEIRTDGVLDCNAPLDDVALLRKVPWRTSHLRTWKVFLWRKISSEDFLGPDGQPLRVGGDLASMYPMIEMAGNTRIKHLSSINYVYNRDNPLNNFRVRTIEQLNNGEFLKSKPPYSELPDWYENSRSPSAGMSHTTSESFIRRRSPSNAQKLFGIGLPGTEPSSFDRELWRLGYRTIVNPPFLALAEALTKYDAATSESVAFRFQEFDNRYPSSRFVLTVCNPNEWLAGVQRTTDEHAISPPWEKEMRQSLYGTTEWEPEQLLLAYDRHLASVTEYFSTRQHELLVLDAGDENWMQRLHEFCGVEMSSVFSATNESTPICTASPGNKSE